MDAKKWKLLNVILLGLGFQLVFTAFQTTSMISKSVTSSLKLETKNTTDFEELYIEHKNDPEFMAKYDEEYCNKLVLDYKNDHKDENITMTDEEIIEDQIKNDILNVSYGDGYISLSVIYAVFALGNFAAPAVVKLFGHKGTMFGSGLTYLVYICMYLQPTPIFMYSSSVLLGFGAAFIWTAQGDFLHLQSDSQSLMARNTGIFWCMFQCSLIIGNVYISFAWAGETYVSSEMRTSLFSGFAVLAAVGCSVFLMLKGACCKGEPIVDTDDELDGVDEEFIEKSSKKSTESEEEKSALMTVVSSIVNAFKLLATKEMILIASLFLYSGFALSFFSGVYPTSVGNSKNLEDSTAKVGLVGICIGVGEVFGGGLFVFGSKFMDKVSRSQLLFGCLFLHLIAFGCVLINIPLTANIAATEESPWLFTETNKYIVFLSAFLLGFGDAGVNNVIYTTISQVWHTDTTSAFALMKCIQSAAAATSFAIASKINLLWNIVILVVFSVSTIVSYISLQRWVTPPPKK